GKVIATIREHDVITVRFVTVGQRLLLDFRTSEQDGPMVRMVDPVRSAKERFRELARLRPRFPTPEKVVAVWWPRFVGSLETTGVYVAIRERVAESGPSDAMRAAEESVAGLIQQERRDTRHAVLGESFRTHWSA